VEEKLTNRAHVKGIEQYVRLAVRSLARAVLLSHFVLFLAPTTFSIQHQDSNLSQAKNLSSIPAFLSNSTLIYAVEVVMMPGHGMPQPLLG